MVCDKCEKKLGKVITPDPWKTGARNTTEGGGRKLNENKALTSAKNRFNPYTPKFEGCRICKQKVHQNGSYYCELKRKRFLSMKTEFYRILKILNLQVNLVLTKKGSVQCVERKLLTLKATNNHPLNLRL